MVVMTKVEVSAETGEPFDMLTPVAIDWCQSVGCNLTKVSDIIDYANETGPDTHGFTNETVCVCHIVIACNWNYVMLTNKCSLNYLFNRCTSVVDGLSALYDSIHMQFKSRLEISRLYS